MRQVVRIVCVGTVVLAGVPGGSVGAAEPSAADTEQAALLAIDAATRPGSPNAIATVADDDIWALGSFKRGAALHWDGETWRVHRTPGVDTNGELLAISALGSDDVWAVGYAIGGGTVIRGR